jgi:IclR family KDG regulon transcriptional repressor
MSIQSIDKALDILSLFSPKQPRLGIADISGLLGLPRPTVHGLVRTLAQRGFLAQDPETRKYSMGLKVFELGVNLCGSLTLNQVGVGAADRLAKKSGLTGRLALWNQDSALVTATLYPGWDHLPFHQLGPRAPAHCSAVGKAILAYLFPEKLEGYLNETRLYALTKRTITSVTDLREDLRLTRLRGYAVDQEEFFVGLVCMGAPIFERDGQPVGSLSLSGGPELLHPGRMESLAGSLIETAREISSHMGYQPEMNASVA